MYDVRVNEIDSGKYNLDGKKYAEIVNKVNESYPDGVNLDFEYADWVQNNQTRLLIRLARYKFASRLLSDTDRVLEVGCGTGLGSMFLSQHSQNVLGIDVKSSDIDTAQNLNQRKNCDFREADFFEEDLGVFDSVVALDVIEHFDEELGESLVARAAKHLAKSHGMLILGTPSIYSYPYQSPISQASHIKCYDQKELKNLVQKYFKRVISFGMNDEVVHTGHPKMSWYYFVVGVGQ